MEIEELKEVIDYIFEKIEELIDSNLRSFGDTFGHELALALKNVFEEKPLIISGDMVIEMKK
ncbi:MAG: hypothetical protein ACFE9I_17925 [Candidatus Hermodarchaeota archaeon]